MSDDTDQDPRETLAHPRHQYRLVGHDEAQEHLVTMFRSKKFHHAWLICGPRGIGKATLAYRLARFVLANPDAGAAHVQLLRDLAVEPDNPVSRLVAARSHPDLFVLERKLNPKTKKLRAGIVVEDTRQVSTFFARTAAQGGWRVCIIDAADDLNIASANAILKILEEPPANCLFIIISHSPGRLLATVRSRCIRLELKRLSDKQVKDVIGKGGQNGDIKAEQLESIVRLSAGSPGRAIELATSRGASQFLKFQDIASAAGRPFDYAALINIAEPFQRAGQESEFNIFAELYSDWLAANARHAAGLGNAAMANALAGCHSDFSHSIRQTNGLNLDRQQTLLMAFDKVDKILRKA